MVRRSTYQAPEYVKANSSERRNIEWCWRVRVIAVEVTGGTVVWFTDETPLTLTTAMMDELWEALHSVGASVVRYSRPGLTRERIEALMRPTAMRLPEEGVVWWMHHDGSDAPVGTRGDEISPQQSLLSLEEALEVREILELVNWRTGREVRLTGGHWTDLWEDTWLPILAKDRPTIACDCAREYRVTTPLRRVAHGDLTTEETYEIRVPSMGTMVQMWIDAIKDGIWTVDPATGFWNHGYWDGIPMEWKMMGFM